MVFELEFDRFEFLVGLAFYDLRHAECGNWAPTGRYPRDGAQKMVDNGLYYGARPFIISSSPIGTGGFALRTDEGVPFGKANNLPSQPRSLGRAGCRITALLVSISLFPAAFGIWTPIALAITPGSLHGRSDTVGFDGCQAGGTRQPTVAEMQAFWGTPNPTPYYDFYFYLGGRALCGPTNVNASWVNQVTNIGFSLVPIWVGPIGNCSSSAGHISCTTTTAYSQGYAEAQTAIVAWSSMGFSGYNIAPALDIEPYRVGSINLARDRAAVKAYVDGWVAFFHTSPPQIALAYGSQCDSFVDDWSTIAHVPDAVWISSFNGQNQVYGISCVPNSHWVNDQRYNQWWNSHTDTRNGVHLNIDTSCADSNVSPTGRFDPIHSGSSYGIAICNTYF